MFARAITKAQPACNCEKEGKISLGDIMNFNLDVKRPKKDINSNNTKKLTTPEIIKEEVMAIRNRFPTKIPIIVKRYFKETNLPSLDKSKFLVPQEITMSQFLIIIRNRMKIHSTHSIYLLVNNRSMVSLSLTLGEVYSEFASEDGFLYITYASQEVFGAETPDCTPPPRRPGAPRAKITSPDNSYKSMMFG